MPSTSRARLASGSVKLPRPQNQSITRSSRLHVEQAQRAPDQHPVDVRVDLGEIGRLEGHRDAELGQRVGQRRAAFVEQLDGVGPLRLQPPLHALVAPRRSP